MDQHKIGYFKKKHFNEFQQKAVEVSKDFQEDAIHQFRVEYKRLRAYIRLASISVKFDKGVKMNKGVKYWYNVLGHLRNLQLQQHRVVAAFEMDQERPQGYIKALEREISIVKLTFSVKSFGSAVEMNKNKLNRFILVKIKKWHCLKFIFVKLLLVYEVLLNGELDDNDFHTIRKSLKDIFNFLSMEKLSLSEFSSSSIFNSNDDQYLKCLIEKLGKFQDVCTAIILLSAIWFNPMDLNEQNMLLQLKEKWVQEKEQLRGDLVRNLIGGRLINRPHSNP